MAQLFAAILNLDCRTEMLLDLWRKRLTLRDSAHALPQDEDRGLG